MTKDQKKLTNKGLMETQDLMRNLINTAKHNPDKYEKLLNVLNSKEYRTPSVASLAFARIKRTTAQRFRALQEAIAPSSGGKIFFKKSEEYRKAKRNVLWASSVTLLLSFATGNEVKAPALDISLAIAPLAVSFMIYTVYLLIAYHHEQYILSSSHSDIAIGMKSGSNNHDANEAGFASSAEKMLREQLEEIGKKLSYWNQALEQAPAESENRSAVMEAMVNAQGLFSPIIQAVDSLQEMRLSWLGAQDHVPHGHDIDYLASISKAEAAETELRELNEPVMSNLSNALGLVPAIDERTARNMVEGNNSHIEELKKAMSAITIRIDEMTRISSRLNRRDRQVFSFHDILVPYGLAIAALTSSGIAHADAIILFVDETVQKVA
ncbi:hypothetical protein HME9302_00329 [Alteripontixanthobacter maritimus]|uniref:Uncharacterized protein n=1 Tax=Alteripontixanthobacter maritimus TaxID=2161824 RepID=A0A369Q2Z7_9SPHN|nr:hypothetical protein [Alteripontixanthobacter maritimus]RDC59144.1 hypothetical protein HME9302_00329 [Alteripontixanthobacter maritimus]